MNRFLTLVFFLVFSPVLWEATPTFASGQWMSQDSGTTRTLYSTWFLNHDRGFAVGEFGTLSKTIDGGNHWQKVSTKTDKSLQKISFYNSKGWITASGVAMYSLLSTNDSGETWQWIGAPHDNQQSNILISETRGWVTATGAANGGVWRTDNGGTSWVWKGLGLTNWVRSLYFYDQNIGYVVNDWRRMWRTNNGGDSWQEISSIGITNWNPQAFAFLSPEEGFFADGSAIYHTVNSGTSWQSCPNTPNAQAIYILDPSNMWAVGLNGVAYYSHDKGTVWQSVATGQTNNLYSVFFTDPDHGWAVGYGGTILKFRIKTAAMDWTLYY